MAKVLCNACVVQTWMFDGKEEAETWLQEQMGSGVEEVLYSSGYGGAGWFLTVTRRYNSALLMDADHLATVGALIAGYEFDHAAAPEVEEKLIYGRYTLDEWNSLSEDEQISIQDKCEYDLQHPDQAEWGVE